MITNCQPDPERLAVVKEATETYGMEGNDPDWPWNVLSIRTVVYTCGAMCRKGEMVPHNHDEAEFALCQRLAAEAIMEGIEVGFGSEASDYFSPFYVVASVGAETPKALTPTTVRAAFGGTIYPPTKIELERLNRQAPWWTQMLEDMELDGEMEGANEFVPAWETLMDWFEAQPELQGASVVMIGEEPLSDENGGCVFPRMAVALTKAGSVVGIYGHTVHT